MNDLAINISRNSIDQFIRSLIQSMGVAKGDIQDDSSLQDLGLDSLDVVELSQGVKKQLLVSVSPADFAEIKTISEAISLVAEKAGIQ